MQHHLRIEKKKHPDTGVVKKPSLYWCEAVLLKLRGLVGAGGGPVGTSSKLSALKETEMFLRKPVWIVAVAGLDTVQTNTSAASKTCEEGGTQNELNQKNRKNDPHPKKKKRTICHFTPKKKNTFTAFTETLQQHRNFLRERGGGCCIG